MNTPPDDNTLALWLDDELEGEELARVEAWAADHPDQLAAREQVREWRKMIGARGRSSGRSRTGRWTMALKAPMATPIHQTMV